MTTRVLWVSKHKLLPIQIQTLRFKLGDYKLIIYDTSRHKLPNAEWLIENVIIPLRIDIVIPVLPLSMIARLAKLSEKYGFQVWWSEMEQIKIMDRKPVQNKDYDPEMDTVIPLGGESPMKYKVMRFVGFYRIKDIRFEMEEV